jgi:hypothetical protein
MNKPKFVMGDCLAAYNEHKVNHIAHQCNIKRSHSLKGFAGKIEHLISKDISPYMSDKESLGKFAKTIGKNGNIYNCFAQLYLGAPNFNDDKFSDRINWLRSSLNAVYEDVKENETIALPLVGSGLAKQKDYITMSDYEYFIQFVYPNIEDILSKKNTFIYLFK